MLFHCKNASKVWLSLLLEVANMLSEMNSCGHVLVKTVLCLNSDQFLQFDVGCWAIWEDQNKVNNSYPIAPFDQKV